MAVTDENLESARKARESLIDKHGGAKGWFEHLLRADRRRIAARKKTSTAVTKSGQSGTGRKGQRLSVQTPSESCLQSFSANRFRAIREPSSEFGSSITNGCLRFPTNDR
jgi:hypothetical protein